MFFSRENVRPSNKRHRPGAARIELLESRQLLSTTIQGYTPAQIRHAYGFDQVGFSNSTTTPDGSGQTIAIIDAYNAPNISNDVQVFDSQFGIQAPDLTVVNQSGGSKLPKTDAGWASETTLDVEWAHAIAPGAKILLVEADSSSTANLLDAVKYARNVSSVSVISMSWGGSEFFDWNPGESSSETSYDKYFTTPSGHQGITFVASSGDSGTIAGIMWPASSPNVLSVGGTTLTTDSNGNYSTETAWGGSSGGYSLFETEPSYQESAQTSGYRSTPDVAYDGDPDTGFAVYDSLEYEGKSGWQEVGGTSAGAPQWASLIAIADQGRTLAGQGTLDGPDQTLPTLYSLYATPGSSGYSTYTSYFNDVTDTGTNSYDWPFGGIGHSYSATTGYDLSTGLGTPKAASVINALDNSTTSGASTQVVSASPFSATFASTPSSPVIAGDSSRVKIQLTNTSGSKFSGRVAIGVYASSDGALSSDDTQVNTLSLSNVKIGAGNSVTEKVKITYPSSMTAGNYYLIASVSTPDLSNTSDATAVSSSQVTVNAQTVDLSAAFASSSAVAVTAGRSKTVSALVKNVGNVTATGAIDLSLYSVTGDTLDSSAELLAEPTNKKLRLRPNASIRVKLRFTAPTDRSAGNYNLLASVTGDTQIADGNTVNNVAVVATKGAWRFNGEPHHRFSFF